MRVLLIGPVDGAGSLTPYLASLAEGLRALGNEVAWTGSGGVPFDPISRSFLSPGSIFDSMKNIMSTIDTRKFDIISMHYGSLEAEQVIPLICEFKYTPVVYHVHNTDFDLFNFHTKDVGIYRDVVRATKKNFNGYVFFGSYSRDRWAGDIPENIPVCVAAHPNALPSSSKSPEPFFLDTDPAPIASMCGFASPWKDVEGLLEAFEEVSRPLRFILAGPFWMERVGFSQKKIGRVEVRVQSEYLDRTAFARIVDKSSFGIFPYVITPTHATSGSIPNYIGASIPVIAYNSGDCAQLISGAGLIVSPGQPRQLAAAINLFLEDHKVLKSAKEAARVMAPYYSTAVHAAQCNSFYQSVVARWGKKN